MLLIFSDSSFLASAVVCSRSFQLFSTKPASAVLDAVVEPPPPIPLSRNTLSTDGMVSAMSLNSRVNGSR